MCESSLVTAVWLLALAVLAEAGAIVALLILLWWHPSPPTHTHLQLD